VSQPTAYELGYICGSIKRDSPEYDARWDFAEAAAASSAYFRSFKRGFEDGYAGKERTP
jgi:hypothetical protein